MSRPIRWEYRVKSVGKFWGTKDEDIQALLNEWGEEGWEAIAVYSSYSGSGKTIIVAKRPLTLATRRRRSMPQADQ